MKIKQNIISFLLGVVLMFPISAGAASMFQFALSNDTLYVDGVRVEKSLYKYEGNNHLPLRATAEALGAEVEYNSGRIDVTSKLTDIEEVTAKCKDSCVMVYVYKDGRAIGSGSGFFYNGYIITAKHVTDAGNRYDIYTDDNVYGIPASLVDIKTDLDISVLTAYIDLPTVKLGDSDKLIEGQKLIAITSPSSVKNAVDECFYSGKTFTDGFNHLCISDSNINQGSSGGAVFDTNGKLIGIVTKAASGNGAAIPINEIKPILEKLK